MACPTAARGSRASSSAMTVWKAATSSSSPAPAVRTRADQSAARRRTVSAAAGPSSASAAAMPALAFSMVIGAAPRPAGGRAGRRSDSGGPHRRPPGGGRGRPGRGGGGGAQHPRRFRQGKFVEQHSAHQGEHTEAARDRDGGGGWGAAEDAGHDVGQGRGGGGEGGDERPSGDGGATDLVDGCFPVAGVGPGARQDDRGAAAVPCPGAIEPGGKAPDRGGSWERRGDGGVEGASAAPGDRDGGDAQGTAVGGAERDADRPGSEVADQHGTGSGAAAGLAVQRIGGDAGGLAQPGDLWP